MIIAPAFFNKFTTSESCEADNFFLNTVPHSVGMSYVPKISLTAIGKP